MNRRVFLGTLGVFSILPGAGRVWRAVRHEPFSCKMAPADPIILIGFRRIDYALLAPDGSVVWENITVAI